MKNDEESEKVTSNVIQAAKAPVWSKEMSLQVFSKQIIAWSKMNVDVPEYSKYQDLIGLKINKDIKCLPRYVNDYVLKVLEKKDDQT